MGAWVNYVRTHIVLGRPRSAGGVALLSLIACLGVGDSGHCDVGRKAALNVNGIVSALAKTSLSGRGVPAEEL